MLKMLKKVTTKRSVKRARAKALATDKLLQKRAVKALAREQAHLENEDVHRASGKAKILLTPVGRRICSDLRRETWYQLMSQAPDKTIRRLAASILMASALEAARPGRFQGKHEYRARPDLQVQA